MVNASELRKNSLPVKKFKKTISKINKKISFVRFACHYDEVFSRRLHKMAIQKWSPRFHKYYASIRN